MKEKNKANAAWFLSDDGRCWATAIWIRVHYGAAPRFQTGIALCTKFIDGSFFSTTNIKQLLDTRPDTHVTRMRGADIAALEAAHCEALRNMGDKEIVALDVETLKQVNLEIRRRTADFHIRRGVWVPLSESEASRLREQE